MYVTLEQILAPRPLIIASVVTSWLEEAVTVHARQVDTGRDQLQDASVYTVTMVATEQGDVTTGKEIGYSSSNN